MGSTNAQMTDAPSWPRELTPWGLLVPLLLALVAGCKPIPTWQDKQYERKVLAHPTGAIYTVQPGISPMGDKFFRERMTLAAETAEDFGAYLSEKAQGDVDQLLVVLAKNDFVCTGNPKVRCTSLTEFYGPSFKFRWTRDPDHCLRWTVDLDTRIYPEQEPMIQVENSDCRVAE